MDELINIITVITTLLAPLTLLMASMYACDAEEYYGINKDNFSKIEINNKKDFILTLVCLVSNLFMLKFVSNEEFSMGRIDRIITLSSYIIYTLLQVIASVMISKHLNKCIPIVTSFIIFISSVIILSIINKYQILTFVKVVIISLIFCLFIENILILFFGGFFKPETKKVYEILYPIKSEEIDYRNVLVKICENKKGTLVCYGEIYASKDNDKSLINLNIKKPFYQYVNLKEYRYECIKFDNVNIVDEKESRNILGKNENDKNISCILKLTIKK